jgi:hypothetical protein
VGKRTFYELRKAPCLILHKFNLLNNKNRSCSQTQQIMMYWCSSCYIRCNILDLLHVSTRVESSSGRELKEQINFFLDIESGVCVCMCVCVCVCLVVERAHYFFTSLFFILLVGEVGGLLFFPINHFTVIHFTVLFHYVFLKVCYVGPPGGSGLGGRFPVGFFLLLVPFVVGW